MPRPLASKRCLSLVYGIKKDQLGYDLYTIFGTPATEAILEYGDECDYQPLRRA